MNILLKSLIWLCAIFLLFGLTQHSKTRLNIQPSKTINYKAPYSYPLSQMNKEQINDGFQAVLEGIATDPFVLLRAQERARLILESHPLSSEAIQTFADVRFLQSQDIDRETTALVQEALARDGRNRQSLRMLMFQSFLERDSQRTLKYIQDILVLNPDRVMNYIGLVNALYAQPDHRDIVLNHLSEMPLWANKFLQDTIPSLEDKDVDSWVNPLQHFLQSHASAEYKYYITRLFAVRLFRLNRHDDAYDFITTVYPEQKNASDNFIVNPTFGSGPKTPLYDWELSQQASVIQAVDGPSGIFVSFKNNKRAVVLQQYSYEKEQTPLAISFEYDFMPDDKKGYFEWVFTCAASREPFFTYRFDEARAAQKNIYVPISARPNNCTHIHIALWAVPGVYTQRLSLSLYGINVRAQGS